VDFLLLGGRPRGSERLGMCREGFRKHVIDFIGPTARRARPRRCAAEQRDELAPLIIRSPRRRGRAVRPEP
jgi:hypothetical protein